MNRRSISVLLVFLIPALVDDGGAPRRNYVFTVPPPDASPGFDLIVRTVNTLQGKPHYPARLLGIARESHRDWPMSIGLIGMQEVKQRMDRCPVSQGLEGVHGATCFAAIIREIYGGNPTTKASCGPLGIVAGSPWEILESRCWKIGNDGDPWEFLSDRHLLEAKVRNSKSGWIVRFYSTHLSHNAEGQNREANRRDQISTIKSIVMSRVSPDELPPIIVGDFNLTEDGQPANFAAMSADYRLVFSSGVDLIWMGRETSFPGTRDRLVSLRRVVTRLTNPATIDDVSVPRLTDHNSPGSGFCDPSWWPAIM